MDTNLIHELARITFAALAAAITGIVSIYGPRIMRALEARIGLDIPDPIVDQAERLALDALAYAEERGRAMAKAAGTKVLGGAHKLNLAAKYFREHASDQVLELVRGQVGDWLEAKLGHLRGVMLGVSDPPASRGNDKPLIVDITVGGQAGGGAPPSGTGALKAE